MTVAAVVAAQTIYQGASPNEYLFPGLCKKANGDFLMMARRASSHIIADGTLVMRTSPTGLTGSWSAETVVFTPSGASPNVAAGLPRLLDDGRIALMCWYNNSGTTPYIVTSFVSTDATATSWVRGGNVPALTSDGVTCESPVVVAPDGTWLLAVSGTEVAGNHPWSSWIVESDDEGATWTFKAWVARTASPSGSYVGSQDHEEPFLLHVDGDTYLCAVRTGETGWTSSTGIYTHIWRSTDGCVTWTDLGRLNSTHKHFSRMAMCRNPLTGTIMLHHRLYGTGGSGHTTGVGQGAYYWTNDNATTWSTGKLLDGDGSVPANPSQPPGHSYGDIVAHDGGFAAIWADEVPPSGTSSAIRFATFSDDAPLLPGPPSITGSDVASITPTTAVIVGNVNPNSLATTFRIEYGTTISYGSATAWVSAGSGSTAVGIEVDLSSLVAETDYHARIVATNSSGTTNGADIAFTTPAPPAPLETSLILDPSDTWLQVGTNITISPAIVGVRSSCMATVVASVDGDLIWDGAGASRFDIGGYATYPVEAGVETRVELGVTPQEGDTALTARIGVPE